MQSRKYVWLILAGLIAPLVPGLITSIPDLVNGNYGMAAWYIQFSAIAGYIGLMFVAIPIGLWLNRTRPLRLVECTIIGLLAGLIVFFGAFVPGMTAAPLVTKANLLASIIFLPLAALFGSISGAIFWAIARPGLRRD